MPKEEKCKRWDDYFENNIPEIDEAVPYDNEAWKYLPLYPEKFVFFYLFREYQSLSLGKEIRMIG